MVHFLHIALIFCNLLLVNSKQVDERHLQSSVQCHILAAATRFDGGVHATRYKCIPLRDDGETLMPLQYEVPAPLVAGYEDLILKGRAYATYTHSYLQPGQEGGPDQLITSPESTLVFQVDPLVDRRRLGVKKTGTSSVFIARVIANDSSPTKSQKEISQRVFGINRPSTERNLVNVFRDCSFGQLTIVPAQGNGVKDGVGDLVINRNIGSSLDDDLLNTLSTQLEAQFDTSGFDHHVYVIPPGTGGWSAGAFIGGYQAYFNDLKIIYVSSQVHELSHNMGMGHSSVAGATGEHAEYEDQSGFMGFSYDQVDYPKMCFNGQKSWEFSWYQQRSKEISPGSRFVGRLNAFVDFGTTLFGDYVVLKVSDIHIIYNSQKGINSQTNEAENKITLTKGGGPEISYRVAELDANNKKYTTSGSIVVEVCEYNGSGDYFRIGIYSKGEGSSCNDNATGSSTSYNPDCKQDGEFCDADPGLCCSGFCSTRDSPNPNRSVCSTSSSAAAAGIDDRSRGNSSRGGEGRGGRGGGGNLRG